MYDEGWWHLRWRILHDMDMEECFVAHQMDNDHAWCSHEKKMIRAKRRTLYTMWVYSAQDKQTLHNKWETQNLYSPISVISRFIRLYRQIHFIRMQPLGCKSSNTRKGMQISVKHKKICMFIVFHRLIWYNTHLSLSAVWSSTIHPLRSWRTTL